MGIKFNLIVARCKNNGIGYKGDLPWSLRKELQYFGKMTKEVKDHEKKNAVIMGRKTWDSLPDKWKPLPDRLNFVLSTQPLELTGAVVCSSFDDLVKKINSPEYANEIETAWIIGGSKIYEDAIKLNLCYRLYLTEILKEFECDAFFNVDVNNGFREVSDDRVPKGLQEENDIKYIYHVLYLETRNCSEGADSRQNELTMRMSLLALPSEDQLSNKALRYGVDFGVDVDGNTIFGPGGYVPRHWQILLPYY